MDVRDFLRDKLAEQRLSMKEASEGIGRNHAYLQQYFERKIPAVLPEEVREKLGELLGVDPDLLRDNAPVRSDPRARPPFRPLPPVNTVDRIPVMGVAEGGGEGKSTWNGEIVDWVARAPSLSGAPNGYATYVIGTSMEPRYHPGELIYVHPGKPVAMRDYVLVQLNPPAEGEPPLALIKRFVKKTATKIVLEQFNPPKQLDIPARDIVSFIKSSAAGNSQPLFSISRISCSQASASCSKPRRISAFLLRAACVRASARHFANARPRSAALSRFAYFPPSLAKT